MNCAPRFAFQPGINPAAVFAARVEGRDLISVAYEALPSAPLGLVPLGSVEFCAAYAERHGRSIESIGTYPESLHGFLGRHVRLAEFGDVGGGQFVKPVKTKVFTGGIKRMIAELVSDTELVWACDPVRFAIEWRAYVLDGQILGVAQYGEGDDADPPVDAIAAMVAAYQGAPVGYSLDVGQLDDGRVLLVEVNDGWALGYYPHGSCSGADYLRLVVARWREIIPQTSEAP